MAGESEIASPAFLGIDLGWSTGASGLAVVDDAGRLLHSTRVRTDDEIATWVGIHARNPSVIAVDAPLIVRNVTGQRDAERLIGQAFGGFGASAHTTNRNKFGDQEPRAMQLARRFGWAVDPHTPTRESGGVCIEVYPHPAMIGLFRLDYRLDYKKGPSQRRQPGFALLASNLETIPELQLSSSDRWAEIRRTLAAPASGDLNRLEGELGAILCAHLAWLWQHRRDSLFIYGSVDDGYIVAPPPPTHRPRRPVTTQRRSSVIATTAFQRVVVGRPTGYAGGKHEQRWKQAVCLAFEGCVLPAGSVTIQAAFTLGPDQRGRNEPDLDNLIKATIDALDDVLGIRTGTGPRVEADDVRVDRINASKRHAQPGEQPGAVITASTSSQSAM